MLGVRIGVMLGVRLGVRLEERLGMRLGMRLRTLTVALAVAAPGPGDAGVVPTSEPVARRLVAPDLVLAVWGTRQHTSSLVFTVHSAFPTASHYFTLYINVSRAVYIV